MTIRSIAARGQADESRLWQKAYCQALSPVECNAQILDALESQARKLDFRLKEVGKDIVKAAMIVVKSPQLRRPHLVTHHLFPTFIRHQWQFYG